MKIVLPITKSVNLLARSNLVSNTTTRKELIEDIFTYVSAWFDNCNDVEDMETIIDNTLCQCYEDFNSFAYTKVVAAAVLDNSILYQHLGESIKTFAKFSRISRVNTNNNSRLVLRLS